MLDASGLLWTSEDNKLTKIGIYTWCYGLSWTCMDYKLAEAVRFELTVESPLRQFSRLLP